MAEATVDYAMAELLMQKSTLLDQLRRIPRLDSFAAMLVMGKVKAVQRQIDALSDKKEPYEQPPFPRP